MAHIPCQISILIESLGEKSKNMAAKNVTKLVKFNSEFCITIINFESTQQKRDLERQYVLCQ